MTTTSAYAPFDASYFQRTPYLSIEEYTSAPTAMDVSNLVSGNAQANATALVETIGRASSWIDQYTCGAWGTLAATSNVENGRVWGTRQGTLPVHTKYWPILEVESFSYSTTTAGFQTINAASITPAGSIWIEPQQFIVQPSSIVGFGLNAPAGIANGQPYYCSWQYVNGWPTSTLSASVASGATSITPISTMGIYPGTTLTLYDLPNDEQVQVASNYVPHTSPVLLTTPVQYTHASGTMVTNLPPAIKQAAILLTTTLIKQRGSGALEIMDMGATAHMTSGMPQGGGNDMELAKSLLNPFRIIFVGY